MDDNKAVQSEKNEIKVVELKNIVKMTDSEIEEYARQLWGEITIDRGQGGGINDYSKG